MLSSKPAHILVDGETVWVGDWGLPEVERLRAVGPSRPRLVELPVRIRGTGVWQIAAGEGYIWATTPRDGALWRIDPKTNKVKRIPLPYPRSASPRTKATYGSRYAGHATLVVEADGAGWRAGAHAPDRLSDPTRRKAKPPNKRDRSHTAACHVSDSLGDGPRAIATAQATRHGHPRSSLGRRPPRARPGAHGSPRSLCGPRSTSRIRTEIGLAPENQDRWQRVGRRPCARTCRLQEQAANGRSRRTLDLLQARRRTSVRTTRIDLQTGRFLGTADDRPAASPSQSDPTQTHKPTAHAKRPANSGLLRAAEGIRTLDLLHGKQTL